MGILSGCCANYYRVSGEFCLSWGQHLTEYHPLDPWAPGLSLTY